MELHERLKKFNISPDSELGKQLIKLDDTYKRLETISNQIKYLEDKQIQFKEDIEVMELLIMYKLNKDWRKFKWH